MNALSMHCIWTITTMTTMVPAQTVQLAPGLLHHRIAFASAMMRVTEGMSDRDVLAILGKPDDVRKKDDLGDLWLAGINEIWCYGTQKHLCFPCLGQVYFDRKGKVRHIFGNKPVRPDCLRFKEDQLRSLLETLDRTPNLIGRDYDPRRIIEAVNRLQPLGEERALAVIDEYLRVAPDYANDARLGLFLVLRVLFDVPADVGYMPRMNVGAPWPKEPDDPKLIPRFPILLDHDIPLLLVSGYRLAGAPERVEKHVEYFRQVGQLRAKPLTPPDNPLPVLMDIVHSKKWIYSADPASPKSNHVKSLLIGQLLRLIKPVYNTRANFRQYENVPGTSIDELWERTVKEVSKIDFQWDAHVNGYRIKGGTSGNR